MQVSFWENDDGESPVSDFIESLSVKAKKKIMRTVELLEKYGTGFLLHSQDMKKLKGFELYELRIIFNNVYYRILCVVKDATCWLLHVFIKKSPHTPQKEINIALARANSL